VIPGILISCFPRVGISSLILSYLQVFFSPVLGGLRGLRGGFCCGSVALQRSLAGPLLPGRSTWTDLTMSQPLRRIFVPDKARPMRARVFLESPSFSSSPGRVLGTKMSGPIDSIIAVLFFLEAPVPVLSHPVDRLSYQGSSLFFPFSF